VKEDFAIPSKLKSSLYGNLRDTTIVIKIFSSLPNSTCLLSFLPGLYPSWLMKNLFVIFLTPNIAIVTHTYMHRETLISSSVNYRYFSYFLFQPTILLFLLYECKVFVHVHWNIYKSPKSQRRKVEIVIVGYAIFAM